MRHDNFRRWLLMAVFLDSFGECSKIADIIVSLGHVPATISCVCKCCDSVPATCPRYTSLLHVATVCTTQVFCRCTRRCNMSLQHDPTCLATFKVRSSVEFSCIDNPQKLKSLMSLTLRYLLLGKISFLQVNSIHFKVIYNLKSVVNLNPWQ